MSFFSSFCSFGVSKSEGFWREPGGQAGPRQEQRRAWGSRAGCGHLGLPLPQIPRELATQTLLAKHMWNGLANCMCNYQNHICKSGNCVEKLHTTRGLQAVTGFRRVRWPQSCARPGFAAGQVPLQQLWPSRRAPGGQVWPPLCLRNGQRGRQPSQVLRQCCPWLSLAAQGTLGQGSSRRLTGRGVRTVGAEPRVRVMAALEVA